MKHNRKPGIQELSCCQGLLPLPPYLEAGEWKLVSLKCKLIYFVVWSCLRSCRLIQFVFRLHEIIIRLKKFRGEQKVRWFRADKDTWHGRISSTLIFPLLEDAWLSASASNVHKPVCTTRVVCAVTWHKIDLANINICCLQRYFGLWTLFHYFLFSLSSSMSHMNRNTVSVIPMRHHRGKRGAQVRPRRHPIGGLTY